MRSSRVPQALTCGLVALLVAACTGEPETPEPSGEASPSPLPTDFEGDPPPGLEGEVLRHLHGDEADAHDILDDPLGVRISPVGGAFLISSGGEDRHLLHDAATGDTLWEGEARFRGFDTDLEGESALSLVDPDDRPFVLDSRGRTLWEPAESDDLYLDGAAVRRPDGWTAEDPYGDYTVLDADGEELWTYAFEPEPEPGDEETDEADSDDTDVESGTDEDEDAEEEEPIDPLGVPVTAWDDTVLLDDGSSALHAYSIDPDDAGEALWSVSSSDEDLELPASAPVNVPQVLGVYEVPDPDAEPTEEPSDEDEVEDADEGDEGEEEETEPTRDVLLVRWAQPEAPSLLSAHDAATGDTLWTLREPGANPVAAPFEEARVPVGLYDTDTATLLLPQASGGATMVAVDLVTGRTRWGLEEEAGAISPAFAHAGLVYGDSRSREDEDRQLVLDAETMDVVSDDLSAYVEAVTETGHAILVQDRQRFVYGPGPGEDTDDAEGDGEPEASDRPSEDDEG